MSPEFLFVIWSMTLCRLLNLIPTFYTKYEVRLLSLDSTFAGKRTYPPQRTQPSISIELYLPTVTCNTSDLIQPVNHKNITIIIKSFNHWMCSEEDTIIDTLFVLFTKKGKIYIFIELNPSNFKNCYWWETNEYQSFIALGTKNLKSKLWSDYYFFWCFRRKHGCAQIFCLQTECTHTTECTHMYQRSYYNNTIKVHIHNFVAMADNIFILS